MLSAVLIFGVLLLAIVAVDSRLTVRRYTVSTDKVTGIVRLAVISDLHSCAYGEGQEELLEAVAAQSPDAVLYTGDIVDERLPEENAFTVLAALARKYPSYYVTGNHEYWGGEAERIKEKIAALGVVVLAGRCATAELGGQSVAICGVDDPEAGETDIQLERAAAGSSSERFSILLAHRPEEIDRYLEYGFDLILSGHAHGGQWRIPGLLNGLLAPGQGLFPKYAGGEYMFEDTVSIVSRGLARESTRVPRVFNPPELVVVELTPAEV